MFDTPQRYLFEDFVRDCARARDGEALFALLQRSVAQYGYDRLIFSVPFDADLPVSHHRNGIFNTYPEDWQKEYAEKGHERLDPVLLATRTHVSAFTWEALSAGLNVRQTRMMREGAEAGLNSGIGVPMRSQNAIGGLGLASSVAHKEAGVHLDLIHAFCTQFYLSYKRLYARPTPSMDSDTGLSPKETEILQWVAAGKTDGEIGQILAISRNTVDTHMRHIFAKLDAHNRVTAVVRAMAEGLIHP